jgi:hypothetical protein
VEFQEIAKRVDEVSKNIDLMDEEELNMKLGDISKNIELLGIKNETEKMNIDDMYRTVKELREVVILRSRIKARMKFIEKPMNYTKIGNN